MYDEETCYEAAKLETVNPQDAKCISTYCASGKDYDEALTPLFNNCPVKELYVSFIDRYGYETRVDFLKAPPEVIVSFAKDIAEKFEKGGAGEVRIIYPASEISVQEVIDDVSEEPIEKNLEMIDNLEGEQEVSELEAWKSPLEEKTEELVLANFDIGSTKDHVKKVQGEPMSIINNVWFYETDMVVFDKMNRVSDYSNFSGKLKIKI